MPPVTRNGDRSDVYKVNSLARTKPIRFELRGEVWAVSSDPDVEVIATMLELEKLLEGMDMDDPTDDEAKGLAWSVVDAKDLVLDLIEDWGVQEQPLNRKTFRISTSELLQVFARITGSPRVADAVAEAITAGMSGAKVLDELDEQGEDGESGPLASRTRSSGRRSSSAGSTSGRRRGGRG